MIDFPETLLDNVLRFGRIALEYWWAWLTPILASLAYNEWLGYQKEKYLSGMKWTVLEVIPPPEILYSSPKAAEHFFSGLHASYGGGIKWKDQVFGGKIPDWFSFEIVSNGGDIHFYIRCTEGQRNLIESLLFAQYPQAEIRVVEDHVALLPEKFDPAQYDLSANEYVFTQPAPYPIKLWQEFEEAGGKDEYQRLDPLAPLLEIMSALRPGEHLALQYILRPTGGAWVKDGKAEVDKLIGKEAKPPEPSLATRIVSFPFMLLEQILIEMGLYTKPEEKKKEEKAFSPQNLTPVQKRVLEAVEEKLTKLAFKSSIRLFYAARKDAFNGARGASVNAMFKQLYYNNLNTFKPYNGAKDKGKWPWLFPNEKGFGADAATLKKKEGAWGAYRKRAFSPPSKDPKDYPLVLSTDELATLWHLPGLNVRAPLVPRVQAKKGQPPAILPTR
ncbi:MAG: hypothetical protein IT406_03180 [Candidatus Yanofskybacteria bacterium]|nr:hypothetical protein [Candidatus Yanofskybacteria bacterium]